MPRILLLVTFYYCFDHLCNIFSYPVVFSNHGWHKNGQFGQFSCVLLLQKIEGLSITQVLHSPDMACAVNVLEFTQIWHAYYLWEPIITFWGPYSPYVATEESI